MSSAIEGRETSLQVSVFSCLSGTLSDSLLCESIFFAEISDLPHFAHCIMEFLHFWINMADKRSQLFIPIPGEINDH